MTIPNCVVVSPECLSEVKGLECSNWLKTTISLMVALTSELNDNKALDEYVKSLPSEYDTVMDWEKEEVRGEAKRQPQQ